MTQTQTERIQEEIERAIHNAKRTPRDKWFRKHWYKAAAQRNRRANGLQTGWRRRGKQRTQRCQEVRHCKKQS